MKFLDFFAGIGGFRLGMEMAGHECVGHCEIDKFADKSYRTMHKIKESEWFASDITRIKPGELPEADCYCFGFPCQAFSIAGNRRGFQDTCGTLFFEVMRLAKERKPNLLFAENVKGLLNHQRGQTFGIIISTMDELGYDVEWQVLNSADFGVPQNRERVFIIGHLRGTCGRKVFPIAENHETTDELYNQTTNTIIGRYGQSLSTGSYIIENKRYTQIRQIIGGSQGRRVYDPERLSVTLRSQGGGYGGRTGLYAEANEGDLIDFANLGSTTRRGRVKKGVANTLDTRCRQGALNGYRIRKLTPRECFRLQGFPDDYFDRAATVNSDSQLYKQAGNSVTVSVVYEIAKRLKTKNGSF